MRKIISITDWNSDELSRERFRTVAEGYSVNRKDIRIQTLTSTISSIHAGFLAYEMALTEAKNGDPTDTVVYVDVDSSHESFDDDLTERAHCFAVIRLTNNLLVCGLLSGYSFAWMKSSAQQYLEYTQLPTSGLISVRDAHARVVAHLADYMDDQLDLQSLHEADVISLPSDCHFVCHKYKQTLVTTISHADLEDASVGDLIKMHINDQSYTARLISHQHQESDSELVIYKGHYGLPDAHYLEIQSRSPSVYTRLKSIIPGSKIVLG